MDNSLVENLRYAVEYFRIHDGNVVEIVPMLSVMAKSGYVDVVDNDVLVVVEIIDDVRRRCVYF